jgi:hypothetical protein
VTDRTSKCICGNVRFKARGRPILCAVCYCDDCQTGARLLEEQGANGAFHDAFGGTPYVTYRDDWIECVEGRDLLRGLKIRDGAPTTRFLTTCCHTPMYLKHGPGWWTSMYRNRFGNDAVPIQLRSQTQHAASGAALPSDVPVYRKFPPALILGLLKARIGILFGTRPRRD